MDGERMPCGVVAIGGGQMKKTVLSFAAAAFLASPATAFDLSQMSDAERAAFQAEVRRYLMENPKVIMEAVAVLEQQEQAQQQNSDRTLVKDHAATLFSDAASWTGGNAAGDITVVEFVDYRCGYCRKAHAEVAELVNSDGNIRFVLKEFPILGDQSVLASRFAVAVLQVAGPENYKTVHDALFAFRGDITEESLARIATDLGLDAAAIAARMTSPEVEKVIADNHALAKTMAISGTPTFVVDQSMLRGYLPLDEMRKIVAAERAS